MKLTKVPLTELRFHPVTMAQLRTELAQPYPVETVQNQASALKTASRIATANGSSRRWHLFAGETTMWKNSLLFWLFIMLGACRPQGAQQVLVVEKQTKHGSSYTIFYPQKLAVDVVTQRPAATDERCHLSVAAAYTDLDTYAPLDLLVCQGRLRQTAATVGFLTGVLTIVGDTLAIGRVAAGQVPPRAQLARASQRQGTVLLQELLVFEGKNQRQAGGSVFQRRALVEFANHRFAVVESAADDLEIQQFADDLLELGAKNALYLDMGDWDEGWYRQGSQVVTLGHRRTDTARQSNWLVFTRPRSAAPPQ